MIREKARPVSSRDMEVSASVPLTAAAPGARVRITGCECGCRMAERLEAMGLRPGVELEIIKTGSWGPVVVGFGASRFALGASVAARIIVEPVDHS